MSTERIFKDGVSDCPRRSLADLGLKHGVANSGSFPNHISHEALGCAPVGGQDQSRYVTTSIVECRCSQDGPESGIGEAIANAAAAAVEMARLGMPARDVVVPDALSTTGKIMQVAAVCMLEPSLPVVCFVTHDLLLSKPKTE